MVHANISGMKPKQLTPEQLREANEFRECGFGLGAIAAAYDVSEYEFRIQVSSAERSRQVDALKAFTTEQRGR